MGRRVLAKLNELLRGYLLIVFEGAPLTLEGTLLYKLLRGDLLGV